MNGCWPAGDWRAWLDGEMPPEGLEAGKLHLEGCDTCSRLCQDLRGRAERITAAVQLLDRLESEPAIPARAAGRIAVSKWPRRAVFGGLVLAAVWAVVLLLLPQRPSASLTAEVPVRRAPSAAETLAQLQPAPKTANRERPAHAPRIQYYVPLDDEPIESGVVVRVSLADSGLLADVIYDEQGRPRAVRPVNEPEPQP